MALEGDVLQIPTSNSEDPVQIGDVVSSEDVAWVDSCFNNDPELHESDWDSLKDALLDIVNMHSKSLLETSETENGSNSQRTSGELFPMSEDDEAATTSFPEGTDVHFVPSEETESASFPGVTDDDDLVPISGMAETARYLSYLRSDSLSPPDPGENIDVAGEDLWFKNEIDSLSDEIFKVWDLDTPAEEAELVQQLKKALAESSLRTKSTTNGVTDSDVEALDDLIAGIADLSLGSSVAGIADPSSHPSLD